MTPSEIDIEPVPPCHVLFRNGHPCQEIITERPRRADKAPFAIDPPSTHVFLPVVKSVGRPRTRPAKPPRIGRGQGWNRIDGLSREKILELQVQGMNATAARRLRPQPVVAALESPDESEYELPEDEPDAELTAEDWKSIKGDMDFHIARDEGEI